MADRPLTPQQRADSLDAMADQARALERNLSEYIRRHRIGDPTVLHDARRHFIEGRNTLLRLARTIERRAHQQVIPPRTNG